MSQVHRGRVTDRQPRTTNETILRLARADGCNCNPHIRRGKGIHVQVAHDHDCPAVKAGRTLLIDFNPGRCAR